MLEIKVYTVAENLERNGLLPILEAAGQCRSWRSYLAWFRFWQQRKLARSRTPQEDTIRYFTDNHTVRGGYLSTIRFLSMPCGSCSLPSSCAKTTYAAR